MEELTTYSWNANIISRHRVTIPDFIVRQWKLEEGDTVRIEVRRPVKHIDGVVL